MTLINKKHKSSKNPFQNKNVEIIFGEVKENRTIRRKKQKDLNKKQCEIK